MKSSILSLGKPLSKLELKSLHGGAGSCTVYFIVDGSQWTRNYYSSGDEEANAERICSDFEARGGNRSCAYSCDGLSNSPQILEP